MKHTHTPITLDTEGLTDRCLPEFVRFGRRTTGMVINTRDLTVKRDDHGLLHFPINEVFTEQPTFIGFGLPNTYLVTPDADGRSTRKLAAFMFWRSKSAVVRTKDRVQAGVLYELRSLTEEAKIRLNKSLDQAGGKRSSSCAHLVAVTLASAGFRFGDGSSLSRVNRPSKFASLLWRHGLIYVDTAGVVHDVKIRVIHAAPHGFSDHFVGVWNREAKSPGRLVRKLYEKNGQKLPAPLFSESQPPKFDTERWQGEPVTVGMTRSSWIGAHFAFLAGQKPTYVVKSEGIRNVPELSQPLDAFNEVPDFITWLKSRVLFCQPIVWLINRARIARTDWYSGEELRADLIVDMLKLSPGPEYDNAVLYNCVVTGEEIRVTGLHNKDQRSAKSKLIRIINWIAAKHVLVARYDRTLAFASELWVYRDDTGRPVLCLNRNSGTYRPSLERLEAFADHIRSAFRVQVRTFNN